MGKKSEIELAVAMKVKEMREKIDLSQDDIAIILEVSRGFIGQVESPKYASKYNLNHLNTLAKYFKCSPRDFLPDDPVE
ncbi:MAG: hypothetical protein RIC35_00780 [Marinoscillum sp.]